MKLVRNMKKSLRNQRGQGTLEWIMMLAIVAAIGLFFKQNIVDWFQKKTGDVQTKAEDVFK
jgi:hypothetical protein